MTYMEALCLSNAKAMAKAMNKLIKEEDYIWGISRDYKMDFHNYIFMLEWQQKFRQFF